MSGKFDFCPYTLLGIDLPTEANSYSDEAAFTKLVNSKFRKMALAYHPDKKGAAEGSADLFLKVKSAKEILLNEESRKAYDQFLRAQHLQKEKHLATGRERRKLIKDLLERERKAAEQRQANEDAAAFMAEAGGSYQKSSQAKDGEQERGDGTTAASTTTFKKRTKKQQEKGEDIDAIIRETKQQEREELQESYYVDSQQVKRNKEDLEMKAPAAAHVSAPKIEATTAPKSLFIKPRPGPRSYADYLIGRIFKQFGKVEDVWTSKDGKSFLVDFKHPEAVENALKNSSADAWAPDLKKSFEVRPMEKAEARKFRKECDEVDGLTHLEDQIAALSNFKF